MTLFMSTEGPDVPPKPGAVEVRYWGSAPSWEAARKLQSKVDKLAPRGTRTYIAHSLVRKDFRNAPNLFLPEREMEDKPYLVLYIDDPDEPDADSIDVALERRKLDFTSDMFERIAFDVYSAPTPPSAAPPDTPPARRLGAHWKKVCITVTEILARSSSSPPGGQV
jgi:hypothetical protein